MRWQSPAQRNAMSNNEGRAARPSPCLLHLPPASCLLQRSQKRHQIAFLLRRQAQLQHKIKKLDCVFERKQTSIVQIRRRLLDPTQGEGLNRTLLSNHHSTFHTRHVEPFHHQVVHQVVCVERRSV